MNRGRWAWLAGVSLAMAVECLPAHADPAPISASEQALFMTEHLAGLHPPTALRYTVHKAGSLEPGFDDELRLDLGPRGDAPGCCSAKVAFARTPTRQPELQVDSAEGNPAIQYFLEHDIADMHRLTGGSTNYFRKRIRLALAENATLRPVSFRYRGRDLAGQEIDIAPYVDDPNRGRYPKLAAKRYLFLLSPAVPGGVYCIRTRVAADESGAPPLLVEEMMVEGAGPASNASVGASAPHSTPDPTR